VTLLALAVLREFNAVGFNSVDEAAVQWIPALGFSCGMDAIATIMIAGRLGYHHIWRRKLVSNRSSPYTSLVIICVESAVLSTLAKALHLKIDNLIYNPIVIPICTLASNLIVLRKALGADMQRTLADVRLSTLRFQFQNHASPSQTNKQGTTGPLDSYFVEGISVPESKGNFSSVTMNAESISRIGEAV